MFFPFDEKQIIENIPIIDIDVDIADKTRVPIIFNDDIENILARAYIIRKDKLTRKYHYLNDYVHTVE